MSIQEDFRAGDDVCPLCETGTVPQDEPTYVEIGVCGDCADRIANLYCYAHSGQYLTWKNQRPGRPAYQKKRIPESLRWAVFERDGYRCLACGDGTMLRADHVVPEVNGGDATPDNLQTLCRRCNSKKSTKTIDYRDGNA